MDRFVDAEGDFAGMLGPGAGHVHEREDDGGEESGMNGDGAEDEEDAKWQRTG